MEDTAAGEYIGRVEALLEEVEGLADAAGREKATELVAAMLELYGEGLERIVAVVAESDSGELAEAFAGDELVSHLLLLHDLHPVPLEARVHGALEEVRPYLESHGGNVELIGIEDRVVRVRLEGSCSGCPSSTVTLKLAIEDAIRKAAPDVEEIEAEGVLEQVPPPTDGLPMAAPAPAPPPTGPQLIQLDLPAAPAAAPDPAWSMAGGIPEVPGGGPVLKRVSGEPVLFVKLADDVYAYRPACPGCGESMEDAELSEDELVCPECANRYEVRRAGRCPDASELHLEPVPLLVDDSGLVKVALGSVAAA